jgi:hypothetical protein
MTAPMELWSHNDLFLDPFRKKWVKKRPEELIRVALVHKMIFELGFPRGHIVIEKSLSALAHLSPLERKKVPNRRLDIVVYGKNIKERQLLPLLLVECKAEPLNIANAHQLVGYNDIVKAPFIALANENEILTGQYNHDLRRFHFVKGFLTYDALMQHSGLNHV